jgi:hypothetical protein
MVGQTEDESWSMRPSAACQHIANGQAKEANAKLDGESSNERIDDRSLGVGCK